MKTRPIDKQQPNEALSIRAPEQPDCLGSYPEFTTCFLNDFAPQFPQQQNEDHNLKLENTVLSEKI